jgi:hypothetical protein
VSLISPLDPAFDPQADWINLPGAILQDFTPPTAPEDRWYRRLVLNTAPEECDDDNPLSPAQLLSESNIVFVEGSITPAPLVDAGPVIFVCPGVPVQIGGSPTVTGGTPPYTINWDFGQLLNDSTIANPIATSNQNTIFTVEVRDANECYNLAQMTLRVVSADAGSDTLTYCSGQSVRIGTPSVAGSNASFNWAPSSGLSCTDCPRPIASPLTNTWYYLTKTVYLPGGDSCQTFDSVFVAVGDAPTNVVDDVVWCYSVPNTFEIGYPAESGFNYTWAPGTYLVSNDSSAVFFNSGNIFLTPDGLGGNPVRPNPFPYILTATNGTCVWYDTMTVTMIRADAGIDGCGPRTIGVNWHPQIPATYQWTLVSGPDNIVGPRNQVITTVLGSDTETSVYELEVCYNGVCCTDQVVVPPCGCNASISYSSPNNCPTSADPINNPVILTASGSFTTIPNYDPAKVQYSWSPCNFLDTCFGSVVRVQDTATRTYTVTVGYEGFPPSAYCAASITISSPSVSLPVYNVGTYNVCELGDSVQIGQPAVGGYSYQWVGPGGFGSVLADPVVSPPFTPAKYYVTVTDIGTGCTIADTALIEGGVIANAGPDKTVCPGAVVRLGVPDSSGGAWQYIWQPANAPWQNGTDSSFAQPEVLVASNLTFYLTVIDTLIGCSSRDTIEITVDANGPGVTVSDAIICAGQSALVGPEPEFNWVYSWSPSTGLSCTNCAQPTANPVSTTTYTVTIIPSGACVVYNENVTVTVSAPPPFALDSVITCPNINAPLNPGLNGQCSGCTYQWSDNWALINPTSVNPTVKGWATGSIPSFTLTVTDSNGCTRQGSLGLRRIPNEQLGTLDTITKCIAETVALNPAEVGACVGCTYSWSPSSRVSNSTIINPSTNINANTTTFFQLTITKPDGCRSVLNRVVAVIPPPVDTLSELSKCPTTPQGNIQLNPAEFGACVGCTYTWSPATGLSATNVINPTVSNIFSATMYTLTVSSPDGCNRIVRRRVTVIPTQNLGSLPDRVRCPTGPSVAINPGLAGECVGCTYSWFPTNNLSSSTIINPTTNTTVDRVYTLTVTQADGCVNSRTVAVSLALPPFSGDPQEICLGESATLGSPFNNPASSYVWSPSAGLSAANVMQPVFTPTTAGVFNFTLFESRLVNGSNCNLNAPVTVVVNSVAAPVIQNSYSICEGTCVEIGLNEADPQVSYFWFPEDFLTCTDCIKPTACPPQSLLYGLSVVDNSTGCFTTVPVNVNVLNVPIPEINVPAPLSTCQGSGDQLLLNVSIDPAIGNYEFNWSPAIGLSNPFTLQPTLNTNVLPAGVYEYVLEVTDLSTGCGNIKDTVTVTVGEVPEAVCPSSFSIFNTADPLPLQGGLPLGGVYSGNGVTVNGGLYYFNPSIAGLGLHSLSYTYTSPNNCNGNCLIQALVLDESLLPVELLSFEANVVGKKVFLDWETASEFNNDRFEVERSTDIITWEHLGSVTGAGTTSIKTSYQFVDNSPLIGVSYYRLKQVDFDGSEEYSPIKQVEFKEDLSVQKVNWHPNPSKGELIIIPNEEINWVVLTDMSGRAVMTLNYNTVSQRSISLGDLPSGIYLISFISDRVLQTDKLVIQK